MSSELHQLHPNFIPNNEMLQTMISMGIAKEAAEIALYNTGNEYLDAAISYVFDNPLECLPNSPETSSQQQIPDEDSGDESGYKMVFVVNGALEMSIGKTAAQVGHATLGLYRKCDQFEGVEEWESNG